MPALPTGAATAVTPVAGQTAGGMTTGSGGAEALIHRFSRPERALHWATAVCVLTAAVTGLVLYVGPLTAAVGRRNLVKDVHVVAGLAMPVPLVLAYAGRWRASLRADIRRLGRWTAADRRWLLSRGREATDEVGKFNAGQKANAAFVLGMIVLMMATGSIMRWPEPIPLTYRTGATFVHDWTAIATWLVVAGHILISLSDPGSLRGMVTGWVTRLWAEDRHPRWAAETVARDPGERATHDPAGGSSGAVGDAARTQVHAPGRAGAAPAPDPAPADDPSGGDG
jgi:formate dehydrogenase subunit gamma